MNEIFSGGQDQPLCRKDSRVHIHLPLSLNLPAGFQFVGL